MNTSDKRAPRTNLSCAGICTIFLSVPGFGTAWASGPPRGPVSLVLEAPVKAETPAASAIPVDPLGVLLLLIAAALAFSCVMIARGLWRDAVQRRPADLALWILALRAGLGPRGVATLRRMAAVRGGGMHPAALVLCPSARAGAAHACRGMAPREARRVARVTAALDARDRRAVRR